jgi:hypothetical protein
MELAVLEPATSCVRSLRRGEQQGTHGRISHFSGLREASFPSPPRLYSPQTHIPRASLQAGAARRMSGFPPIRAGSQARELSGSWVSLPGKLRGSTSGAGRGASRGSS